MKNFLLLSLLTLLLSSCLQSPQDVVCKYLDFASESPRDDYRKVLQLMCDRGVPLEGNSNNKRDIEQNLNTKHYIRDYEIGETTISEDGKLAIVNTTLISAIRKKRNNRNFYLYNVDGNWLINDGYSQDFNELKQINSQKIIRKEDEELAKKQGKENFDDFIKRFANDYNFQFTRIEFPVGISSYTDLDGITTETKISKSEWNTRRFDNWIVENSSKTEGKDGSYTYTWTSDGGAVGGSATFTLINKLWQLTDYKSW